jgi:hypothetical protein
MSSRDRVTAKIMVEHGALLHEHDDPRGIPCFASALLDVVHAARTYDDALDLLGDAVTFV